MARYNALMGADTSTTPTPTIETDLPCAQCGYNLRTQPADGRCPECNHPVAVSVEAHRGGDPFNRRRIAWGAAAVVVALFLISTGYFPLRKWLPFRGEETLAILGWRCVFSFCLGAGATALATARRWPTRRGRCAANLAIAAATCWAVLFMSFTTIGLIRPAIAGGTSMRSFSDLTSLLIALADAFLLVLSVPFAADMARRHRWAAATAAVIASAPMFIMWGSETLDDSSALLNRIGIPQPLLSDLHGIVHDIQTVLRQPGPSTWAVPLLVFWAGVAVLAWRARRRVPPA
jgi:hypothetical protein